MSTRTFFARVLLVAIVFALVGLAGWFWFILPQPFDSCIALALGCALIWALGAARD